MALITVNNLTFGYDGSCDNIFEHASFQIDTEWRLVNTAGQVEHLGRSS